MIHELSNSIACFYGDKANYTKDEIEICTYGLELIISDAIAIFIAIIIALFTKNVLYTIILIASFASLRLQAGGFHASSHLRCNLIFFAAYIMSLLIVKFTPIAITPYLVRILSGLGLIAVCIYAPVAHPNKPVSKKKKKKYRFRSLVIVIIFCIIALILSLYPKISQYAVGIAMSIFYAGLSIVAERLKQSKSVSQ